MSSIKATKANCPNTQSSLLAFERVASFTLPQVFRAHITGNFLELMSKWQILAAVILMMPTLLLMEMSSWEAKLGIRLCPGWKRLVLLTFVYELTCTS